MRLTDYSSVREDNLGMVHNVPVGYTAYAQAKHIQLVEKNSEVAIPLFWAAINAGDRVESTLKNMAIAMKQLGRTLEAIEAIKSFRHCYSIQAQESLDNILLDLYKRNLGWAYMQQLNYPAAELLYRKSLHFDADGNKACNLGMCLIKQRKMEEAVAVLVSINAMDKKDATSVDCVKQLLKEIKESEDELRMVEWGAEIDYNIARKRNQLLKFNIYK
ncbi:hypothetical protein KI387_026206 [Taxus chinensis]|uniref:Tetratricopeptide repeat protein n=1 Tax=Taxus chinensis TaxID=29808 RepID=A0AA38FVK5_TAXCH|nr:hypothetical protein KI387_026206 [Taxus chinensis]